MTHIPNNDDTSNDDIVFDRLVDGELSVTERQQLLASLDDPHAWGREQGWRRCALAFLEAQAWGDQLKQMIAESPEQPASVTLSPQSPSKVQSGRWLALAAGLLLAFSLGWLINPPSASNERKADLAVVERQEIPLRGELPERLFADGAVADDAVTLLVRDSNGKNQRFQVPLMDVEEVGDDLFGAALPAEVRARFRDRGFDIQRRRRFAPMFFEQNQQLVPMVVPVDDTYVVPVSRPVY